MQKECFSGEAFSYMSKKKRPSSSRNGPSPLTFLSPRKQSQLAGMTSGFDKNSFEARGGTLLTVGATSTERIKPPLWLFTPGLKKLVSKSKERKRTTDIPQHAETDLHAISRITAAKKERVKSVADSKPLIPVGLLTKCSNTLARRSSESSEQTISGLWAESHIANGEKIVPAFAPGLLEKINSSGSSTTDRKSDLKQSPKILHRTARLEKFYKNPVGIVRTANPEINIQHGFALDVSSDQSSRRKMYPAILATSVSPSRSPPSRSAMPVPPDILARLIDPSRTESISHKLSGKMSPRTTSCELLKMSFGETPRSGNFECETRQGCLPRDRAYGMCTSKGRVKQYNEDKVTILDSLLLASKTSDKKQVLALSYFGLFDGHGGEAVSRYLSQNLHELLATKYSECSQLSTAFKQAIQSAEEHVLSKLKLKQFSQSSGSTALVAAIDGRLLDLIRSQDMVGKCWRLSSSFVQRFFDA